MTHLASADAQGDPMTDTQLERFAALTKDLPGQRSLANSAGAAAGPRGARPSGCAPASCSTASRRCEGRTGADEGLRPVMTLTTRLIAVKEVQRRRDGRLRRHLARGAADAGSASPPSAMATATPATRPPARPSWSTAAPAALAGRVSMDMIALDLTDLPEAEVGTPVTLWGSFLPVETIAGAAGTIAYELLCGITGRVHVQVTDEPQA